LAAVTFELERESLKRAGRILGDAHWVLSPRRVLRICWAILPARSSVPGEEGTEIGDANAI